MFGLSPTSIIWPSYFCLGNSQISFGGKKQGRFIKYSTAVCKCGVSVEFLTITGCGRKFQCGVSEASQPVKSNPGMVLESSISRLCTSTLQVSDLDNWTVGQTFLLPFSLNVKRQTKRNDTFHSGPDTRRDDMIPEAIEFLLPFQFRQGREVSREMTV